VKVKAHDPWCPHSLPQNAEKAKDRPAQASSDHAGHAILHDFCMTMPYGAAATVAGAASYLLGGGGLLGMTASAAGAMICMSSFLSLQCWRQGQSSALYTLISAGGAGPAAASRRACSFSSPGSPLSAASYVATRCLLHAAPLAASC
jgi:hypothetical protein